MPWWPSFGGGEYERAESLEEGAATRPIGPSMSSAPPREGARYRAILGLVAIGAGIVGLAGLFFIEVPAGNKEALLLALGIVLGWGSTVVGYEFDPRRPGGRRRMPA